MNRLLVLGLDGLCLPVLEPFLPELPTFSKLIENGSSGALMINIVPIHSAACWTTIFTGVPPEMHGIIAFTKADGSRYVREDLRYPLIWETLYQQGVDAKAFHIPCFIPPLNFRVSFPFNAGDSLPLSPQEAMISLQRIAEKTIQQLAGKPDFLATVFVHLDRLLHLYYDEPSIIGNALKETDEWLRKILLAAPNYQLLIISDHGFTDIETSRKLGISGYSETETMIKGDHSPEGIYISTDTKLICSMKTAVQAAAALVIGRRKP